MKTDIPWENGPYLAHIQVSHHFRGIPDMGKSNTGTWHELSLPCNIWLKYSKQGILLDELFEGQGTRCITQQAVRFYLLKQA
jgi:hypothetical protein